MAGFQTHVAVSTSLGVAYAAYGAVHGVPVEAAAVAAGLCGAAGMVPDVDSDSGRPVREILGFAAAVTPMLLVDRLQHLGFNYEQMVLAAGASYLLVRFGLAKALGRLTVHRGMFHSIPALLIVTGLAFLVCGSRNLQLRYFKAGAVFLGMLSHLVLDEVYSVEWKGGRWRFKSSFGTALKLWGEDPWANMSTYLKLAVVGVLIASEPAIMDRYGQVSPVVWEGGSFRQRIGLDGAASPWPTGVAPARPENAWAALPPPAGRLASPPDPAVPQRDRSIYDTARRIWSRIKRH